MYCGVIDLQLDYETPENLSVSYNLIHRRLRPLSQTRLAGCSIRSTWGEATRLSSGLPVLSG